MAASSSLSGALPASPSSSSRNVDKEQPRMLIGAGNSTNGVWLLHEPAEGSADFDVVFFHGLQVFEGNQEQWLKTWYTQGNNPLCWPQFWLPSDFDDRVRVMAVSYDSSATMWKKEPEKLWLSASHVVSYLESEMVKLGSRPFFLVGHSMGGLLIKELLLNWSERRLPITNCKGIAFYGVPHLGATAAGWVRVLNKFIFGSAKLSVLVTQELQLLGEECFRRNQRYNMLAKQHDLKVVNFYETEHTFNMMVVPKEIVGHDADLTSLYPVPGADHFNVCRPCHKADGCYAFFIGFVKRRLREDAMGSLYSTLPLPPVRSQIGKEGSGNVEKE